MTGIPFMAAAQMQRWVLVLATYQCDIQYIPSKENANADMLSRLQVDTPESAGSDEIEYVCMLNVDASRLTADSGIYLGQNVFLHSAWMARFDELYTFFVRKEELSLEDGCIVWGKRIVIPSTSKNCFMSYTPCTREW